MYTLTVKHSSMVVDNYDLGDCEKLEKRLSVWNPRYYRLEPVAYDYDTDKKRLYLPRGLDIVYVEKILNTVANIDYTPDPYDTMSIRVKTMPRDDIQKKSISYLIGEGDFNYTKKYSQMLLNLPTSVGKTYVTTAALQFLAMKCIVITPTDRLKEQWFNNFIDKSDLDKSMICDVNGSATIKKLLKSKNLKYKIYLVNHGTLSSYAKSNGWEAVGEFFRHIKVGVKVYDEAHLNFENTLHIDFYTNTKKTIYLTATFERSDFRENYLFNICFKNLIKYGYETRQEVRKHILYLGLFYNSKPDLATQGYMSTNMGFNKVRYADYQLSCDKFYNAITYCLNFFKDIEGKIMIMCTTISLVDSVVKFINDSYEDLSAYPYHSKISDEDKTKALSSNIIVTTPKSAGTGVDIPGLRAVIMCEAYSSNVQADQISGRLREYAKDKKTCYVELVDRGFPKVLKMYQQRLLVFKKKCTKLGTIDIDNVV